MLIRILPPVLLVYASWLVVGVLLLVACDSGAKAPPPAPAAKRAVDPQAALRSTAEARYLPAMTPALAGIVRSQPWFGSLTQAHLDLVAAIQKCEKEALRRGEGASVPDVLQFASEQGWYQDGLDDREALALAGIFEAYGRSLADTDAPPIGPVIASSLRSGLFDVLNLPETGQMVVVVSADDLRQGEEAMRLTLEALPKVETIVGKYPYHFLHVQVVKDLPPYILGVSYNEFVAVSNVAVDENTVLHEVTHSTLYGIFPIWFEEGMAHFIEHHLTNSLDEAARLYTGDLAQLRRDPQLDVRFTRPRGGADYLAERARGFLFLKGLHDIRGIDGIRTLIRELRTHTYGDQDLIRAIVQQTPSESMPQLTAFVCKNVIGTTRNYCAP